MVAAIIFMVIAVGVVLYLAIPFFVEQDDEGTSNDMQILLSKKEFILQEIQDVKQDHDMAKISDEDFKATLDAKQADLADVLGQIDAIAGAESS